MVGKLNLDLGEDYAYDVRRARAVAEAAQPDASIDPIRDRSGPFDAGDGVAFYIGRARNGTARVGFNVDDDPPADVWITPAAVAGSVQLSASSKNAIHGRLVELGYGGVPGAPF